MKKRDTVKSGDSRSEISVKRRNSRMVTESRATDSRTWEALWGEYSPNCHRYGICGHKKRTFLHD